MRESFDQLLNLLHPWEFVATVHGKDHPSRRPAVGQLVALVNSAGRPLEATRDLVAGLFYEPDVRTWDAFQLTMFISAYLAYFIRKVEPPQVARGRGRKKRDRGGKAAGNGGLSLEEFITALLVAGIAQDWASALMMPADVAMVLLSGHAGIVSGANGEDPREGKRETVHADGSRSMSFGSLEELSSALAGAGWSGLKIGR